MCFHFNTRGKGHVFQKRQPRFTFIIFLGCCMSSASLSSKKVFKNIDWERKTKSRLKRRFQKFVETLAWHLHQFFSLVGLGHGTKKTVLSHKALKLRCRVFQAELQVFQEVVRNTVSKDTWKCFAASETRNYFENLKTFSQKCHFSHCKGKSLTITLATHPDLIKYLFGQNRRLGKINVWAKK